MGITELLHDMGLEYLADKYPAWLISVWLNQGQPDQVAPGVQSLTLPPADPLVAATLEHLAPLTSRAEYKAWLAARAGIQAMRGTLYRRANELNRRRHDASLPPLPLKWGRGQFEPSAAEEA